MELLYDREATLRKCIPRSDLSPFALAKLDDVHQNRCSRDMRKKKTVERIAAGLRMRVGQ